MVCDRCVLAVEEILQNEAIPFHNVIYGEVHLQNELIPDQKERLIKRLDKIGFGLIDNRSAAIIEHIKQ